MKRTICGILAATTLVSTLSAGAMAAPMVTTHSGLTTDPLLSSAVVLDELEMQNLHGKFVMLPWILGITGLDLALIGVYWGTFVPNYAQQKSSVARDVSGEAGSNR